MFPRKTSFSHSGFRETGFHTAIGIPLIHSNHIFGIYEFYPPTSLSLKIAATNYCRRLAFR